MAFSPEFSGLFRLGSVFSLRVTQHLDAPAVRSTAGASRHPSLEAEPMDRLPPEKRTFLFSNFDQGIKRWVLSFHATLVNGSLNFIRLLRVVFSSRSNRLIQATSMGHLHDDVLLPLRACLHGSGGPQVGEVKFGGSPHLSCERDQIKMRDYIDRAGYPT